MKPVRIDFGPRAERPGQRIAWLLLGAALAALALVLMQLQPLWHQRGSLHAEHQRAVASRETIAQGASLAQGTSSPEQQAAIEDAVGRLRMPWAALLSDIESASDPQVALLSLEPNAALREVRIHAQAKDLPMLLAYVRRLSAVPSLVSVRLESHQIDDQHPQRPVDGAIVARWHPGVKAAARDASP